MWKADPLRQSIVLDLVAGALAQLGHFACFAREIRPCLPDRDVLLVSLGGHSAP